RLDEITVPQKPLPPRGGKVGMGVAAVETDPPPSPSPSRGEEIKWWHAIWLIGGSMLIGALCLKLGHILPAISVVLNPSGWAFLLVTFIGILLSLTPAAKLERYGASR